MKVSGIVRDNEVGLHAVADDGEFDKAFKSKGPRFSGKYKNDISGQVLRNDLVKEARQKEFLYFLSKVFGPSGRCTKPCDALDGRPSLSDGSTSTKVTTCHRIIAPGWWRGS